MNIKSKFFIYLLAIIIVLISIFPIVWLVMTSFKTRVEIFSIPPVWFPKISFENYIAEFSGGSSRLPFLLNSLKVAFFSTIVTIIIGSLAAFGIARFPVPVKKNL